MENLNAEQIIKALECCKTPLASDCKNCSYTGKRLEDGVYEGCVNCLVGDALALITSQEQRIKELAEERDGFENLARTAIETQNRMSETIEELTEENKMLSDENYRLSCDVWLNVKDEVIAETIEQTKKATVKQFAERLKEDLKKNYPQRCGDCFKERVDQIAKEMLEEE